MNSLASDAFPGRADDETDMSDSKAEEKASTGGGRAIGKWQVVAKTSGLAPARIIANRLVSEGIPARAWQEGAGQAFGLTVGLLGTGYVVVPSAFRQEAESLLAESPENSALAEEE